MKNEKRKMGKRKIPGKDPLLEVGVTAFECWIVVVKWVGVCGGFEAFELRVWGCDCVWFGVGNVPLLDVGVTAFGWCFGGSAEQKEREKNMNEWKKTKRKYLEDFDVQFQ